MKIFFYKRLLHFAVASAVLLHSVSAQNSREIKKVLANISPAAIEGHMTFLSDDLLEGRQPGTRGFQLASKYMEAQFISLGLKPAANATSYIQQVPLKKGWIDESKSSFTLHNNNKDETLTYGKEFLLSPYFSSPQSSITAPIFFAGFGISAPEFNFDDYRNIDVKGKIVVYINDAPTNFPSGERAYFTTADVKYTEAIKRGAVAVISFTLPSNKRSTWDASVKRARQGFYKWVNQQGLVEKSYPDLKAVASLNNQYIKQLFANAPTSIDEIIALAATGKSRSFPLNISATIKVSTNTKAVQSSNVVGMIEGSDPALKNECIVYTAHLDHFGIGAPVKSDSIYNGAHDDASGNAILLEVIKAYRSLSKPPKRSIVFAIVTGEELGLLGSDYFVNNQPPNLGKVVANLGIDMPFFFHPVLDIVPYGADHSSLGVQTAKAAKLLGLKMSPDPFPEQVVFIRSDHYSFIKKGVPALFIKSGFMTVAGDTTNWSRADVAWRTTTYHTPQDDMHQAFNFYAATMHVKVNFLIGYFVANETTSPAWNKGDFFGQKFTKKY